MRVYLPFNAKRNKITKSITPAMYRAIVLTIFICLYFNLHY